MTALVPTLAWMPLTAEQRSRLALLAKRAWERRGQGEPFDAWRHEQSRRACGRRITEAMQPDFLRLKAHFLDLAGSSGEALRTLMRGGDEARRIAMHKLREACLDRDLDMNYPAAICRRQFRCTLEEASPKQLWNLVFTIRNRRKALKSQTAHCS